VAEILSKYYPSDVSMHSFDDKASSANKKRDNWGLLVKVFKKRGLDIAKPEWEAVVACEEGAAVALVDRLHKLLGSSGPGAAPPPRAHLQQQQQHMMAPNGMVSPQKMGGGYGGNNLMSHHGGGGGGDHYGIPGQVASPPTRVHARVSQQPVGGHSRAAASSAAAQQQQQQPQSRGSVGGLHYAVGRCTLNSTDPPPPRLIG
jgi:hypothetical protein